MSAADKRDHRENWPAKRIVLVTHEAPDGDDSASRHLSARGFELEWVAPALGETLPELDERTAGAIIYGGGPSVNETARYPYLKAEMEWAGRCLAKGVPFLGICLGGQVLARHLGANVGPPSHGLYEFGFYPLLPSDEGRAVFGRDLHVMQFHCHGFDLPRDAVHLARSETYPRQAFRVGENAYGLQFHPEATASIIAHWHRISPESLNAPGAHSASQQIADFSRHGARMTAWFTGFLDTLFQNAPFKLEAQTTV